MTQMIALLDDALQEVDSDDTLHEVGCSVLNLLPSRPREVLKLAHRKLYAYHFSEVPEAWRRCFEDAGLHIVRELLSWRELQADEVAADRIIALLDRVLIMTGAPRRRSLIDRLLVLLENKVPREGGAKKRRLNDNEPGKSSVSSLSDGPTFPMTITKVVLTKPVPQVSRPSILAFQEHVQRLRTPLVLLDSIDDWPALSRWARPSYWLEKSHQGRRLVPVELGRCYTDDGWGQRLMPLKQFIDQYMITTQGQGTEQQTGYLAQHDLLTQIPALRSDIRVPDCCYIDTTSPKTYSVGDDPDYDDHFGEPIVNMWLGPSNTITPAHTDPHHNLLAQVTGRKYVRLYRPDDADALYPIERGDGIDMSNTSQVDVGLAVVFQGSDCDHDPKAKLRQSQKFPRFEQAQSYVETVLEAGQLLYVPKGWFHYVRSLDTSASVSFWWG